MTSPRSITDASAAVDEMVPPRERNFVGPADFKAVGREFLSHFVSVAKLQPHERVLDIGCGIGRMAVPLTQYLQPPGSYDGFDVVASGIEWCETKITPRYPHFRFKHVAIRNQHYTPDAEMRPRDFRFPYRSGEFDFVFLASVFTHMLPADMEHYLDEIVRVLKPSGRCLMTMFLLNAEAEGLMAGGQSHISFPHPLPDSPCRLCNATVPEQAVAYDEAFVRRLLHDHGFDQSPEVHYGSWTGRKQYVSYQDLLIARSPRRPSLARRFARWWTRTSRPTRRPAFLR